MASDSDELQDLESLHARGLLSDAELHRAKDRRLESDSTARSQVSSDGLHRPEDGVETEALSRIPASGGTLHEDGDPPPPDRSLDVDPSHPSSSRPLGSSGGRALGALAVGLFGIVLAAATLIFFSDDIAELARGNSSSRSKVDKDDDVEEPSASPADICDRVWVINHPERPFESSEENWRDVQEMKDCHDDHEARKLRMDSGDWDRFAECIAEGKTSYDVASCTRDADGGTRSASGVEGGKVR